MARIAGSDITASPSQLVARTNTFDMEDGLKATNFQNSKSGIKCLLWGSQSWPMPLNLAKRGECCGIGGADPLIGGPSGPGRPRPAFGTTVSVPGGAQEADGGVVPRGDPMVLGIGVKTSGGGHKM